MEFRKRLISIALAVFCASAISTAVADNSRPPAPQHNYFHQTYHNANLLAYSGGGGAGGSGGSTGTPLRLRAMRWAHAQGGCWYEWGGTSCRTGFDCSGLVMEAYKHAGVQLPRTTYEMLGSRHLRRVRVPRRGDLAFYGSGHVELVWQPRWDRTWGAHDSGTRVGSIKFYPGTSWAPTAYYEVIK